MKRFLLVALLLSSTSYAGTIHKTFRSPQSLAESGKTSADITLYALNGGVEYEGDKTCSELFSALDTAVEPSSDALYFTGGASCSFNDTDQQKRLSYTFLIEARTVEAIPLMEAYLAGHEGTRVEGNPLHYQRAFGIFSTTRFRYIAIDAEGNEQELALRVKNQMFRNLGLSQAHGNALAASVVDRDAHLELLRVEFNKDYASSVREELLPATNLVRLDSGGTTILEDQSLSLRVAEGPYELDCRNRDNSNGFCF